MDSLRTYSDQIRVNVRTSLMMILRLNVPIYTQTSRCSILPQRSEGSLSWYHRPPVWGPLMDPWSHLFCPLSLISVISGGLCRVDSSEISNREVNWIWMVIYSLAPPLRCVNPWSSTQKNIHTNSGTAPEWKKEWVNTTAGQKSSQPQLPGQFTSARNQTFMEESALTDKTAAFRISPVAA